MVRPQVADAARVNARWCDVLCRTPPLYPDAVTPSPDASVADVLDGIDTSSGCSVKDSFGCLDLSVAGFEVLFEATWITCTAQVPLESGWSRVDDPFGNPPDCPICTLTATSTPPCEPGTRRWGRCASG